MSDDRAELRIPVQGYLNCSYPKAWIMVRAAGCIPLILPVDAADAEIMQSSVKLVAQLSCPSNADDSGGAGKQ